MEVREGECINITLKYYKRYLNGKQMNAIEEQQYYTKRPTKIR
ncbi:hypothetical protein [Aquimarina algicola]|nr:hypothetical protein [Aquimarina algicola]